MPEEKVELLTIIPCILCIRLRCRLENLLRAIKKGKNKCIFAPLAELLSAR